MTKTIQTRPLCKNDLPAIVEIDERTSGVERRAFWEGKILIQESSRPPWTSLVAEIDIGVVGFVFGHYIELEFGLPGAIAWIDIIGVDPGYRRQGVARELIDHFTASAEDVGVDKIFTLVSKTSPDMEQFFIRLGFSHGQMIHYQKELTC